MLNAAICDDDPAICRLLERMLIQVNQERPIVEDIDSYYHSTQLWQALNAGQYYDVVFLDISMPELDGITLGRKIRKELGLMEMQLVYISGDAHYALDLYDNYPLHFLVKDDKLTLQKVREVLLRAEQLTNNGRQYFDYVKDRLVTQIPLSEIVYFESARKLIHMHTTSGSMITFRGKLDDIEKQLRRADFLRIHQSYLVNGRKITKLTAAEVSLGEDVKLTISRAYQKSATKWLESLLDGDRL